MVSRGDPAIRVRDLRRRFGSQEVLRGVTIDFPQQQVTTLVGPSGCGKTVFLKHLNLLLRPDSGQIIIDGIDVTRMRARGLNKVRERFGMLFQAGALFDSLTIFDNVAFPLVEKTRLAREEIAYQVRETLTAVGLDGVESRYPSELSGGMQKRAALARALIRRPGILLLDEPTTGLDPMRTGSIHALVRRTQQRFGLTAVLVSHDVPQVFDISDRIAFMHEGRIRISGTVAEVTSAHDEIFDRFLAGKAAGDDDNAAAAG